MVTIRLHVLLVFLGMAISLAQAKTMVPAQVAYSREPIQSQDDTALDSQELAWNEFAEANQLRKKLNIMRKTLNKGEQSPVVARMVLGLLVGATKDTIDQKATKLASYYKSRAYRGDPSLVPEIVAIIMNAKRILLEELSTKMTTQLN